jgi:hypothetical protein
LCLLAIFTINHADDTDHRTTGIRIGSLFETRSVQGRYGGPPLQHRSGLGGGGEFGHSSHSGSLIGHPGYDRVGGHKGAHPVTNRGGINHLALSVCILFGVVGYDLPAHPENKGQYLTRGCSVTPAPVAIRGSIIHQFRIHRLVCALSLNQGVPVEAARAGRE